MINNITGKIRRKYISNKRLFIDIIILVLAIFTTTFLLIHYDVSEKFYEFSRDHEDYDLDEIVVSLAVLSFYLLIFLFRRFYELRKILIHANTDALIGIFNRRKGSEFIEEEIKRVKNKNYCSSLIMFDIDHFKSINDTYGHDTGDYVLKELVNILKDQIRDDDILIRWGGEEFMIICPTDLNSSVIMAERFRKSFERYTFKDNLKVTASFGVIELNAIDDLRKQIIKVDNCLYMSKDKGRNLVTKA